MPPIPPRLMPDYTVPFALCVTVALRREGWGGEGGGGVQDGNTCTPTVDSCQGMAKPIQYCKVSK